MIENNFYKKYRNLVELFSILIYTKNFNTKTQEEFDEIVEKFHKSCDNLLSLMGGIEDKGYYVKISPNYKNGGITFNLILPLDKDHLHIQILFMGGYCLYGYTWLSKKLPELRLKHHKFDIEKMKVFINDALNSKGKCYGEDDD